MWKTLHRCVSAYCDLIRHHYTVERQDKQHETYSPKSDVGNEVTCSSSCRNHALNRGKCWFPLPLHSGSLKSCDVLKIILIFRNLRLDNLDNSYDAVSLQDPPPPQYLLVLWFFPRRSECLKWCLISLDKSFRWTVIEYINACEIFRRAVLFFHVEFFWDVTLCGLINSDRHFEGWQLLHILGSKQFQILIAVLFPEDGGSTILRNRENCNPNIPED